MSVLAWWIIPVTAALLVGALVHLWGRRPRISRSFEEVRDFHGFLDALERGSAQSAGRDGEPTA
jgi:hypothetical protein